MNIELRHFKLIKAIVEKGTLSEASGVLHQTPSALSYQLKEAEFQVGAPLFDRIGKKLVINSIGQTVLKSAEVILQELETLSTEVKQHLKGEAGQIRISTECHTSYYWLPAVLKKFEQHYPHIKVNVLYNSTGHPLPLLLGGELDMMISYTYKEDHRIKQLELFRDEMVAIMATDHPLCSKAYIEAEDFTEVTLITHAPSLETANIYEELLKKKGLMPANTIHIPFTEAGIALVKAGIGIMVLPRWMLRPYHNEQELVFKPITSEGVFRRQYLSVLNNKTLPDYYHLFISYLKEELTRS
ncbi:LysR family transcriptional regulator [Mucilaginibacter sp. Bleaf8]|uniref:LysR family transcriptional regulator n=1 Tax=Mucilaginibacter sp. Bleaf8 TaxID=2834430 RepID=UPI001BCB4E34|nr:LysR family transcriptional regulator [Mucilaginibacter sp. Bleaf8]MBS7567063.1 LysR family transcriptional regulator [Mucilaginibacter sp. Bleaf8]